jgi:hypothetical protein
MNFPSNILSVFNSHAGPANPRDAAISVPNVIQPVLVVPEQVNELSAIGDSVAVQRTSFMISNSGTQTNAVGGSTNIVNIGAGLWDLDIAMQFVTNYTDVLAANRFTVRLVSAIVASSFDLLSYYAATNEILIARHFLLAIPNSPVGNNFAMTIGTPTNGVGQTVNFFASVIGNRLG